MLNIYTSTNPADIVSSSNPIISAHDLALGSWSTMKLYIRNSDATKYYTNIELRINDLDSNPTSEGRVYMLKVGSIEPTALEWGNTEVLTRVSFAGSIGTEDAGDTDTYLPFFLRVYVPADDSVGFLTECSISIVAIQEPVI